MHLPAPPLQVSLKTLSLSNSARVNTDGRHPQMTDSQRKVYERTVKRMRDAQLVK